MELIPAIKPRHYSISSSMKMCPDSVHLLVVLVDWQTPKGRTRYGQCTRYMAGLDPADDVYLTVDIKPSAMHLPPNPSQPIIMAGLGTGMAPFRAFVQEREWQRQQGMEVGPVMLYFGSRHRHEEYLYGEFLDEMYEEKLITHLGLAFSRDQKEKVRAGPLACWTSLVNSLALFRFTSSTRLWRTKPTLPTTCAITKATSTCAVRPGRCLMYEGLSATDCWPRRA